MAVVGIDLGTTNTVVAAVRGGRATALKDEGGRALLPSIVSFPPNGHALTGHEAKQRRTVDPENTVFSVKRLIGRSWDSEQVQKARKRFPFELVEGPGRSALVSARGQSYTLPELSAHVLGQAKAVAELRLDETVDSAVITVPANFNDLQRAATKVAGRVAGLEVLRILNEPTAAALAYGLGKKGSSRIAIYDLGGGTFDVTLLELSENVFEVLATAGDTFLGGDDIDLAIAEKMADALLQQHRVDARQDRQIFERLRAEAELLKMDLSKRTAARVTISEIAHGTFGKAIEFDFSMKRAELDQLAAPFVNQTINVCREALQIAGLSTTDFDQILLVGGSTRSPLVRRKVSNFFGKMPQSRLNPDEVVALGAAIQATALESKTRAGTDIPAPPVPAANELPGTRRSAFPSSPSIRPLDRPTGRRRLESIPPDTREGSSRRSTMAVRRDASLLSRLAPSTRTGLGGGHIKSEDYFTKPSKRQREQTTDLGVAPPSNPVPAALPPAGRQPPPLPLMAEPAPSTQRAVTDDDEPTQIFHANELLDRRPVPASGPVEPEELELEELEPEELEPEQPREFGTSPVRPPAPGPVAFSELDELDDLDEPSDLLEDLDLEHVSIGADEAIEALDASASEEPAEALAPARPPLLIDVTPLALGVEVVGGYCDVLIERNSPIPCERSRVFATARDGQTVVRVRVSQGPNRRFDQNTVLGEVELTGLRRGPRGSVSVDVTFALDENGILDVSAQDTATGTAAAARLKLVGLAEAS